MTGTLLRATALAALLYFANADSVKAGDNPSTWSSPGQQQQMQTVLSDQKLDAYADAAIKVAKISLRVSPEIRAADNEEQRKDIFLRMQEEMVEAVHNTEGITVQEYNEISLMASQDSGLADDLRSRFEDLQQSRLQ